MFESIAYAAEVVEGAPQVNPLVQFMPIILMFVIFYFLLIRPQQKKQKELAKFRNSLEKGDKVVTLGGIYGVVAEVRDQYVLVEVDSNVKLRIDKSAIVKDITDIPAGK